MLASAFAKDDKKKVIAATSRVLQVTSHWNSSVYQILASRSPSTATRGHANGPLHLVAEHCSGHGSHGCAGACYEVWGWNFYKGSARDRSHSQRHPGKNLSSLKEVLHL